MEGKRLFDLQKAFARHIRDPEHAEAPGGVEDRRMAVYREIFYNNIQGFLASNFPVIRELLDDRRWHALCRDFFAGHHSHTPLFPELPREFLRYLQDHREAREDDPPFLLELAHYEWVELALMVDDHEIDQVPARPDGDLLHGVPVASPLAWMLAYDFPVHRIRPDYQPEEPPADSTYLVVYRDSDDDVRFLELNSVSARLLRLLKEDAGRTGLECLEAIAGELGHSGPSTVVRAGRQVLEDLRQRDILLGTRPQDYE